MHSTLDHVTGTRTRRELAAVVAWYAMGCSETDLDADGEVAVPVALLRNDAEREIVVSLQPEEVEAAAARAAIRTAPKAESCAIAQEAYIFAAGCLERIQRRRQDIGDHSRLIDSVYSLARRYGAYRTPPRAKCRPRAIRTRRTTRRCTSRARSPGREPDPELPRLVRLVWRRP